MNLLYPKALLIRGDAPELPWVTMFYPLLRFRRSKSQAVRITGGLLAVAVLVVMVGYGAWQLAADSVSNEKLQAGIPSFIPGQPDAPVISPSQPLNAPLSVIAPSLPSNPNVAVTSQGTSTQQTAPQGRRLIISKIGVNMAIVEGQNERALLRGAWRSPWSSSPDKGSNTVIFGHRYLHLPPHPETFFNLDKLAAGDTFEVQWDGRSYIYRVVETKVVPPNDISVLRPTSKPTITLITCTPVFTTKMRLIVRAELIE